MSQGPMPNNIKLRKESNGSYTFAMAGAPLYAVSAGMTDNGASHFLFSHPRRF